MADYSEQINQLAGIVTKEFTNQKNGKKLNSHFFNFWSKAKKVFQDDLVSNLELNPDNEETSAALNSAITEQFQNQRFIAHVAMFINQYERS